MASLRGPAATLAVSPEDGIEAGLRPASDRPARGKIMLVSEIFPPIVGGSGRWFWEVYRRLPRREVVIAAGVDPGQDEFDRTHDLNVLRMELRIRPPGLIRPASLAKYGRAFWRLRRLAGAEGVTTVHSGCVLPEGILALALKASIGLPYLCYAHGEEFEFAQTSRELAFLARRVLAQASMVVANSRNTERVLIDTWHVPASRVRVMHPGVDTRRFTPAPRDRCVRAQLGWGERPVLLTVARLQKGKGHDRMIEAIGVIRRAIPDILYAAVGDGPERGDLTAAVRRLGLDDNVLFMGATDEAKLVRCYQQCDLFVLPNRRVGRDVEGFGIVLLEAQACGRPVVAGDSGGTAETMRVPETGRIVPCDSVAGLAEELMGLMADRDRLALMGEAARRWAVERFDWSVLGRRADELFWGGVIPFLP